MASKTENVNMGYVVFLAVVAAIGGILFGYDTAVISGTTKAVTTQFALNTIQEGWYVGCALIGSIIGVLVAGMLSDGIGRKRTMLIAALMFSISALGCAIAANFSQLVVFRMFGGFGIGVVSIVSPMYISEVAVASKRGTLVALYQLMITLGFLLAYLVNFIIYKNVDESVSGSLMTNMFNSEYWRGMLGCNLIPDLIFLVVIFFIPESPRWLLVKGRGAEASAILQRIYITEEEASKQAGETLSAIGSEVKANWKEIFEPGIFRAVLIGCAIAILGQFMGVNAVLYYGPKIFEDAGMTGDVSLLSTVLVGVVNFLTTIIATVIIDKVGRKQLVYWGVSSMIVCLLAISLYFFKGAALGLGNGFLLTFFLLYVFSTAISISAVVFVILSEMYPNRVRGLAMSIAGMALWVGTYLIGQLTPWFLANLTPAGTFLMFAVMCIPYMLIMWKLMPETTGMTLEEIERYWKSKGRKK
ncbi:MAG: sugar porter family MFS transporter [Bacteroidales bacterium]|nr:sugar porter family MFS transporter [Bacteroidales bacterium]